MIQSYNDYINYLDADRISLGRVMSLRSMLFDDIWKFQRLLRKYEYLHNCKKSIILKFYIGIKLRKLETKLGFSIPPNVFGPGLSIVHYGTIVVNPNTRIGANCRIHVCVNIGTQAGKGNQAPVIGDNCYIGPGAKLFGNIVLGDNIVVGANSVVNKSFPEGNVTIAGVPARIISQKTSKGLIIEGFSSIK